MTTKATAMVQYGPRHVELEEFDLPKLDEGSALIRVEANGVCHTDVDSYFGDDATYTTQVFPRILGHEIVGIVEELGPGRNPRPGLKVGDRVALNPFIGCGRCTDCLRGDTMMCHGFGFWPYLHGQLPLSEGPGLWGGYSTHVYAHPNTVLYQFPEHVSGLTATFWNPLAAGFQWSVTNGGVGFGSKLLILGPGQRGLASVLAARAVGAELVVVTGISKDETKLRRALDVGADAAINVETDDLIELSRELTGGEGFDVVLDTTPGASQPLRDAVELIKPGGTIVLAGMKGRAIDGLSTDTLILKRARVVGSMGQDHDAYLQAAKLIATGRFPEIEKLRTHVVSFDRFDHAVNLLTGAVEGEDAINVVVTPPAGLTS